MGWQTSHVSLFCCIVLGLWEDRSFQLCLGRAHWHSSSCISSSGLPIHKRWSHSVHDLCHDALLPQSPQSQVNVDWPLRNNESYWIVPSLSCVSEYFIKGIESWQTCLVFVPENLLPQGLAISRIYLCFYSTSLLPSLHPISPLSLDNSLPQHDSFRLLTQSHCLCSIVLFISPCSFIKLSILLYLGT